MRRIDSEKEMLEFYANMPISQFTISKLLLIVSIGLLASTIYGSFVDSFIMNSISIFLLIFGISLIVKYKMYDFQPLADAKHVYSIEDYNGFFKNHKFTERYVERVFQEITDILSDKEDDNMTAFYNFMLMIDDKGRNKRIKSIVNSYFKSVGMHLDREDIRYYRACIYALYLERGFSIQDATNYTQALSSRYMIGMDVVYMYFIDIFYKLTDERTALLNKAKSIINSVNTNPYVTDKQIIDADNEVSKILSRVKEIDYYLLIPTANKEEG